MFAQLAELRQQLKTAVPSAHSSRAMLRVLPENGRPNAGKGFECGCLLAPVEPEQ